MRSSRSVGDSKLAWATLWSAALNGVSSGPTVIAATTRPGGSRSSSSAYRQLVRQASRVCFASRPVQFVGGAISRVPMWQIPAPHSAPQPPSWRSSSSMPRRRLPTAVLWIGYFHHCRCDAERPRSGPRNLAWSHRTCDAHHTGSRPNYGVSVSPGNPRFSNTDASRARDTGCSKTP